MTETATAPSPLSRIYHAHWLRQEMLRSMLGYFDRMLGKETSMTEQEWLASSDPKRMLEALLTHSAWREDGSRLRSAAEPSDRKLRLFGIGAWWEACELQGWSERNGGDISTFWLRQREIALRFADGAIDRQKAVEKAGAEHWGLWHQPAREFPRLYFKSEYSASFPRQAALLRDIIGNPFVPIYHADDPKKHADLRGSSKPHPKDGPHVVFRRSWRTANVLALSRCIYESRGFEDMPILADALEDAGCTSEELLAHLRGRGPHALGCWALDLILGKG